eukprot:11220174-Lingulodinium_polyedra.AAC.1
MNLNIWKTWRKSRGCQTPKEQKELDTEYLNVQHSMEYTTPDLIAYTVCCARAHGDVENHARACGPAFPAQLCKQI